MLPSRGFNISEARERIQGVGPSESRTVTTLQPDEPDMDVYDSNYGIWRSVSPGICITIQGNGTITRVTVNGETPRTITPNFTTWDSNLHAIKSHHAKST